MTAKSFFYASAGIFLLVAAYTLGARHARADFDPDMHSHVVGASFRYPYYNVEFLRSDGTVWGADITSLPVAPVQQGGLGDYQPLPVATSEILFWGNTWLLTRSGELFSFRGGGSPAGRWASHGTIPLPTVSVGGKESSPFLVENLRGSC